MAGSEFWVYTLRFFWGSKGRWGAVLRFPERLLLKLEPGTIARVDAVCGGNRSEWLRRAVLAALDGGVERKVDRGRRQPAKRPPGRPDLVDGRLPDEEAVMQFLRGGPRTERQIKVHMGWTEMRVSRCIARLGRRVKFSNGAAEIVEDSDG